MGEFVARNMELIISFSTTAPVGSSVSALYQKLYIQFKKCSWGWRICRPKYGTDQFLLNHGTGRQQCQYTVPKAVYTVKKVLLRMGEFVDRNVELISSISTTAPVGSSVGALYQKLYIQLKMGSWGWANLLPETCRADFKKINQQKSCCILLVAYNIVLELYIEWCFEMSFEKMVVLTRLFLSRREPVTGCCKKGHITAVSK